MDTKELKRAIDTGKVYYGIRQARKALKRGEAKMFIVASNCPFIEELENSGVKVVKYDGHGLQLGAVCGKPFNVSVITIVDPGESKILKG